MPWVKAKDSYTGKRHYVESVERRFYETRPSWPEGAVETEFFDVVSGQVCTWIPQNYKTKLLGYGGSIREGTANGKPFRYTHGGASVVEQVNLMRNAVCTHCRAALIKRLDPAVQEALKGVTL